MLSAVCVDLTKKKKNNTLSKESEQFRKKYVEHCTDIIDCQQWHLKMNKNQSKLNRQNERIENYVDIEQAISSCVFLLNWISFVSLVSLTFIG